MTIDEVMRETAVPVVVADDQGLITYVNPCFESVFGWRSDDILGAPLTAMIPKAYHDAHNLGLSRFLLTGEPVLLNRPIALKTVTRDGREVDAEHYIIAEQRQGRWVLGATIRPLDEPDRAGRAGRP
jgi:PAS domain S-box-containing protein